MTNEKFLRCVGMISDDLIVEYHNYVTRRKVFNKKLIVAIACVVLACFIVPIGIFSFNNSNAKDRHYEATHKTFTSIEEAEKVIGKDFLFSRFSRLDIQGETSITLGVSKENAFYDKSNWTDIECSIINDNEKVILHAFITDDRPNIDENFNTTVIGKTDVKYFVHDDGTYTDMKLAVQATFEYDSIEYIFYCPSNISLESAMEKLINLLDE